MALTIYTSWWATVVWGCVVQGCSQLAALVLFAQCTTQWVGHGEGGVAVEQTEFFQARVWLALNKFSESVTEAEFLSCKLALRVCAVSKGWVCFMRWMLTLLKVPAPVVPPRLTVGKMGGNSKKTFKFDAQCSVVRSLPLGAQGSRKVYSSRTSLHTDKPTCLGQ